MREREAGPRGGLQQSILSRARMRSSSLLTSHPIPSLPDLRASYPGYPVNCVYMISARTLGFSELDGLAPL